MLIGDVFLKTHAHRMDARFFRKIPSRRAARGFSVLDKPCSRTVRSGRSSLVRSIGHGTTRTSWLSTRTGNPNPSTPSRAFPSATARSELDRRPNEAAGLLRAQPIPFDSRFFDAREELLSCSMAASRKTHGGQAPTSSTPSP